MAFGKAGVPGVPDGYAAIQRTPLCARYGETVSQMSFLSDEAVGHGIHALTVQLRDQAHARGGR